MNPMDKLNLAREYILSKIDHQPEILIILGSGLGYFTDLLEDKTIISYNDIPYFGKVNVTGHVGELHFGYLKGKYIVCMKGRMHYYQGVTDEEMRFPIQLFRYLDINQMIVTNACGGMNPGFKPGDLMIIEDHINMMGRNPLIGDNLDELGPRFSDMSEPYFYQWIELLEKIASDLDINIKKGVYVGYSGPSYETKAEIKAYRMLGGDAVGMSTVPEVIIGAQLGMKIAGISCITNMSTGLQKEKLSHQEVLDTSKRVEMTFSMLLEKFIERI